MTQNHGVYIPQIDGKDLWLSNYAKPNTTGYNLLNKNGEINKKRYRAVFDYSLDLIQLRDVYKRSYRNNRFSYIEDENGLTKEYCDRIINVTFKYSVKAWNRCGKDIYIKVGIKQSDIRWDDCLGYIGDKLVGVQTQHKVSIPYSFEKDFQYNENTQWYEPKSNIQCIQGVDAIRKRLYSDGFYCNGVHYVRWKRSSGSARVGKCLFVDEKLFPRIHNWEMCGLDIYKGDKVDLAALQSYVSLTSSSIIGTIELRPENILVIDDYDSVFTDDCINVTDINGVLQAKHENVEIRNSIWDGQSIIDPSGMGEYADKGMILLRNRFFKSCAFSGNIQQWFADNGITEVSQLNGKTRAKNISDIRLITTPNSIKYLKFSTLDRWLDTLEPTFGVVKYEKPPHYLGGKLVQTHYQLLNSIQLNRDDVRELLQPSFDFLDLCRDNPAVLKHWIKYKPQELENESLLYKNDVIYKMMSINERFYKTKLYFDFKQQFIRSFIQNMKCGHVYVNGNYSVLCGNPIEMLMQSIGRFNGSTTVVKGAVCSKRFEWGKVLLGSRSPHITASNVLLTVNLFNENIDRYMNATNEIVYINSIGENILQKLAGADFDSDTLLLTDNETLINAAKKTNSMFKVAVSNVSGSKRKRFYNTEDMTDLDIKTSNNLIGDIINCSQELNTLIWDSLSKDCTYQEIEDIYLDVCKLSILSGCNIDSAKKEFNIDFFRELTNIRTKYKMKLKDKTKKPWFFAHIVKKKGFYDPTKKAYVKYETSMDYLQECINSYNKKRRSRDNTPLVPFSDVIKDNNFRNEFVNHSIITEIFSKVNELQRITSEIYCNAENSSQAYYDCIIPKCEFVEYLNQLKLNKSTIVALLQSVESKENSRHRMLFFYALFQKPNTLFLNYIRESKEHTASIISDVDGNINIFGYIFREI